MDMWDMDIKCHQSYPIFFDVAEYCIIPFGLPASYSVKSDVWTQAACEAHASNPSTSAIPNVFLVECCFFFQKFFRMYVQQTHKPGSLAKLLEFHPQFRWVPGKMCEGTKLGIILEALFSPVLEYTAKHTLAETQIIQHVLLISVSFLSLVRPFFCWRESYYTLWNTF